MYSNDSVYCLSKKLYMEFDITRYTQQLRENRMMRNNQEVDKYEEAIAKIYEQNQLKFIPALCTGFDDKTEHEEVMWTLLHAIEDFYAENPHEYDRIFLDIVDNNILLPHAEGWLDLLVTRTINDENSRETFKESLRGASDHVKQVIRHVLNKLIQEDAKQFRDSCIEVLTVIG